MNDLRSKLQIALALFLIFYGIQGVWDASPFLITGRFVYNGSQSELQFVNPTPSDNTVVNFQSFSVNLSGSGNVTLVLLEINGVNQSLTQSGSTWHYTNQTTGNFSVIAYANMSNNGTLASERRTFRHGYVNISSISNLDLTEDTNMTPFGLFQYISSNTNKQSLLYNLTFDNDNLQCYIDNYNLSCMPKPNQTGRTIITLKVTDGPAYTTQDFTINITKVDDVPYIISVPNVTLPEHKKAKIELSDYIADVESGLTYIALNNSYVHGYMDGSELMVVPQSTGFHNITVKTNDTFHQVNLTVNVNMTPNNPPQIFETAIVLANWSKNNVHAVRLNTFFYDPDGDSLTYNVSPILNISASVSAKSVFFVPDVDWVGTRTATLQASDGQYQIERVITLRVDGSSPVVVEEEEEESNQPHIEPAAFSLPDQTWREDTTLVVDLAELVDLEELNPDLLSIAVSGLSDIKAQVVGTRLTLSPKENFHGKETAQVIIEDGSKTLEGPMSLTVVSEEDPIALMALPAITLDENRTQYELNLAEYFSDPDGEELNFDIEAGEGVNVTFKSKSVVILSLGEGGGNTSARIIARSSSGKEVSSDMLITLVDAIQTDRQWGNLFAQLIIAILLLAILGVGVSKYKTRTTVRSSRIKHIHNTIDEVYEDPEMRRTLKIQAQKHTKVITPSEQLFKILDKSYAGIIKAYNDYIVQHKSIHGEPPKYRREVLYIKETISSLRAIISSTNDRLIAAALTAEKNKLMRAYHSIQGKADLSRDDLRKLLLYSMESASALQEVSAVSEDTLITFEIRKQARRMRKVTDSLAYKLEDTYKK